MAQALNVPAPNKPALAMNIYMLSLHSMLPEETTRVGDGSDSRLTFWMLADH